MPDGKNMRTALQETYGAEARKWFVYWRLFYLACSELFRYDKGEQWGVMHYTFTKQAVNGVHQAANSA